MIDSLIQVYAGSLTPTAVELSLEEVLKTPSSLEDLPPINNPNPNHTLELSLNYHPTSILVLKPPKMQITHLLATAITLTTASASTVPPTNNKWAQLRLFGSPGCEANNLLEMGVYGYQKNQCQNIAQYGTIEAVNITSIFDECECK